MLSIIIISSSFVGCQNIKATSPEATAKSFLKGFYEVENYDQLKEIEEALIKIDEGTVPPEGGEGIGILPEDKVKKYVEASLSHINPLITSDFGDTLMANRSITKNLNLAKEYNYTTKIKAINLEPINSTETKRSYYYYKITLVITYPKEIIEEQVLEGSLGLLKEDGKWLVDTMKENNSITQNKEFYSFDNGLDSNSNTVARVFSSAEEFCTEYIKAILANDASFIYSYTINAGKSNTLEEYQQMMDSIKVTSIKVTDSEVRDNKAYYELEILVSEPGDSAYSKGKNIRWLYLSSGTKGGIKHWAAEGLMSSGKPNEQWWNIINGG